MQSSPASDLLQRIATTRNVNATNSLGQNSLHVTFKCCSVELIKAQIPTYLLARVDPYRVDNGGQFPGDVWLERNLNSPQLESEMQWYNDLVAKRIDNIPSTYNTAEEFNGAVERTASRIARLLNGPNQDRVAYALKNLESLIKRRPESTRHTVTAVGDCFDRETASKIRQLFPQYSNSPRVGRVVRRRFTHSSVSRSRSTSAIGQVGAPRFKPPSLSASMSTDDFEALFPQAPSSVDG